MLPPLLSHLAREKRELLDDFISSLKTIKAETHSTEAFGAENTPRPGSVGVGEGHTHVPIALQGAVVASDSAGRKAPRGPRAQPRHRGSSPATHVDEAGTGKRTQATRAFSGWEQSEFNLQRISRDYTGTLCL